LKREWNSPIYAFFAPELTIEYIAGHHLHVFWCTAKGCKKGVRGYLDKSDAQSTGNMHKHVKAYWGEDVLQKAFKMSGTTAACKAVKSYVKSGSIPAAFDCQGGVSYSHQQHTKLETSGWPFEIVRDHGFQSLMKTGCPEYYIPDTHTVRQDVLLVFAHVHQKLVMKLQSYEGWLSFSTDTWTAPNHKAFAAVMVHLIEKGEVLVMPLDFFEVARVSTHPFLSITLCECCCCRVMQITVACSRQ
ncbi:hypothetical protein F5141DRAFT_1014150, partial [Pisolithus sp. B1]